MRVKVGVCNRHVHLTETTYKYLFDNKEIEKRNDLNQIGEFASTDTVDLEYDGKIIENVRVVGPYRSRDQIELLGKDIEYFNIDAPTRRSGDLDNTPCITLKNGDRTIITNGGVIRAERHVHVPSSKEDELNIHERDEILVITPESQFTAKVKVSEKAVLEVHIDKDEAEEYGIVNGQEVEMYHVEN